MTFYLIHHAMSIGQTLSVGVFEGIFFYSDGWLIVLLGTNMGKNWWNLCMIAYCNKPEKNLDNISEVPRISTPKGPI